MKKLSYRPEIDGLRAIAVLAVILFHAEIETLSGGFIGVDIFFVISGYLITAILIQSLQTGTFSFSSFYARRAKRLLPAALVMILVTVLFGAIILSPEKYYELAKSATFSNLFMANVWFMKHSGYFDVSTQISPLVHMWSLSVEEQFYFVYPLVLFFAYKLGGVKAIYVSITAIIIVTFALNIAIINVQPDFTFYMLPTRAWELGLGALIHFIPALKSHRANTTLSSISLLAIFYALFSINENDAYPGYLALIPTIASAVLIYTAHGANNVIQKLLSTTGMVFIGKISYSAYLWHWPIIVFYRIYINQRNFSYFEVIALILVSMIAGYFSWRYIENRYRYNSFNSNKVLKVSGYCILTSSVLISSVLISRGFPVRVSPELQAISNNQLMRTNPCVENITLFSKLDEKFCVIGEAWEHASRKGIVWGDSHSLHYGQVLHQQAKAHGISLVIAPRKCPAYLNMAYIRSHYPKYPQFSEHCTFRNQQTLEWLDNNPDIDLVILASAWSSQLRMHYTKLAPANKSNSALGERNDELGAKLAKVAFEVLLTKLASQDVLIIADMPRPNRNLNECAFSENTHLLRQKCSNDMYKSLDTKTILAWHKSSNALVEDMATQFNNVSAIIPSDYLCEELLCKTYISGELIYRDDNHIRSNLSNTTAAELAKILTITQYFEQLKK